MKGDPFDNVVQRDIAEKCSNDVADVLLRAFQLCDTQQTCVVVGVAGVGGAVASLVGAFYAAFPEDELTEQTVDVFWNTMIREIVVQVATKQGAECSKLRAQVKAKPIR